MTNDKHEKKLYFIVPGDPNKIFMYSIDSPVLAQVPDSILTRGHMRVHYVAE